MIRHLLKLVWYRKRANALVIAEIFFSFLVLFGVLSAAITFSGNWGNPIGFDYHDVWDVELGFSLDAGDPDKPELRAAVRRMIEEARSMPEVVSIGGSTTPPYAFETIEGVWMINKKAVRLLFDDVTDGFGPTMGVKVIRGRWFNAEDDASSYQPVVLDANAAKAIYGDDDPIGKKFDEESKQVMRVVGVVEPFRKNGEMSSKANMVFRRVSLTQPVGRLGGHLLVRIRPGTPSTFEEELVNRFHRIAPQLSPRVRHMTAMRDSNLRFYLAPVIVGGVLALFLISMVALGLTGVLWQSVTRRTREIGLRRAMGATGPSVHRQILGEVALLATLALIAGAIVVLQLPLLGFFSLVTPASFAISIAIALATIYALTLLCGLYPSWLASRLQPADALRYE